MALPKGSLARKINDLAGTMADVYVESLREFGPQRRELFLNATIEMLETHRKFIAAKIQRLEGARSRSRARRGTARRRVRVKAR